MSHYTTIRTNYNNKEIFKKTINDSGYCYTQHKNGEEEDLIEIFIPIQDQNKLEKNYSYNFLTFHWNRSSYIMITDPQSWRQKNSINLFLKKLQLNYSYSETINQAMKIGFQRSQVKNNNTRFVFQKYVEVQSFL